MTGTSKPWLVVALLWTLTVLTINSLSVNDPSWRPPFAGADKVTHAAMYGAAAYAWCRAIRSRGNQITLLIALAVAALGAVDEWHQRWVPGRSAEIFDWLADAVGAAAGVVGWRALHARRGAVA